MINALVACLEVKMEESKAREACLEKEIESVEKELAKKLATAFNLLFNKAIEETTPL